jgi:hypothetical protein
MPAKLKKETKKKNKQDPQEKVIASIKEKLDDLEDLVKQAKQKFDKIDGKTKKQIVAGVIGAAAILAGAIGTKKALEKVKKEK